MVYPNPTLEVDTSGLACPMPVLKAHKVLGGMKSGDVLKLITTDSGACEDVPTFVKATKNELIFQAGEAGKFVFVIKKR
jgi:tRNA 2-thiouridine synthesizing protein A